MFKRFFLTLALALGIASPAMAAGTIALSLTQQFDNNTHLPLSGGQLYLIQAGTTSTPQNCYQDTALTIPHPNPITLDSGGRVPQLFCADGSIKVRLTNSSGVQQFVQDNILVIGGSDGGGGGGSVDPTTVMQTGHLELFYGTGVLSGFVRCNGRTIGGATSGATERANADTQALFQYLWTADTSRPVSGGRGASASADWAANKTLTLPDCRGRVIAGLDDMGNTAAGILTSTFSGSGTTVLGSGGGSQSHALTVTEMPSHSHGVNDPGHHHSGTFASTTATVQAGGNSIGVFSGGPANTSDSSTGISIQNSGGGGAHSIVQPTLLATIYIKL